MDYSFDQCNFEIHQYRYSIASSYVANYIMGNFRMENHESFSKIANHDKHDVPTIAFHCNYDCITELFTLIY